jgi:hypothetical protein
MPPPRSAGILPAATLASSRPVSQAVELFREVPDLGERLVGHIPSFFRFNRDEPMSASTRYFQRLPALLYALAQSLKTFLDRAK